MNRFDCYKVLRMSVFGLCLVGSSLATSAMAQSTPDPVNNPAPPSTLERRVDNDWSQFGLFGLLGLAGLAGLIRKKPVTIVERDDVNRRDDLNRR